MARQLRIIYPGAFYHIFSRGNDRQAIFHQPADYREFLAILAECCHRFRLRVYAFCLMPNHYHVFLETLEPSLSSAMRRLNGVYTQRFNRRYDRVGHLLQGRFKAKLVDREAYGLALSRYIHLNPCRAKLTARPEDYAWSSARHLLGLALPPPWLDVCWTLAQFGQDRRSARRAYRRFLADGADESAVEIIERSQGPILGDQAFADSVKGRGFDRSADSELPELRRLAYRPSREAILEQVATRYGHTADVLRLERRRNHPARRVAIYLVQQLSGSTHRQTGQYFGGIGYTAVSQCVRRVERQRRQDKHFDDELRRLEAALSVK